MINRNALLQRGLKKLWASKAGGVLIYVAFGLPILLGAMALSIDLGRAFILNTELKDFSDAAALAGAAELDGRDGARVAAEAAARTGISNTLLNVQAFATDGGGDDIVVDEVVFLRELPADGTDFDADDTATSDADARFIFVSVVNRDVASGLSRALGVTAPFEADAKSIAGFTSVTCKLPVMFMCNPLEDVNFPLPSPLTDTECDRGIGNGLIGHEPCLLGRGMQMKDSGGNGAQYFPGEYGLLQCPPELGGKGADCVAESIAQSSPAFCVGGRAHVKTGQATGPINAAVNVRFDHYMPQFGGNSGGGKNPEREDANYRPAFNVQKGWEPANGNSCATEGTVAQTLPLPRDSCFYDPTPCERYGDGDWHIGATGTAGLEYWDANHGGPNSIPMPDGLNSPKAYADMTRYEVYRYEIEQELANPNRGIPQTYNPPADGSADVSRLENGKACNYDYPTQPGVQTYTTANGIDYTGFSDPALPGGGDPNVPGVGLDRRLLNLAAVNCLENAPLTGASSNNPDGLEIKGVVEVFLTEPAWTPGQGGGTNNDIWGEIAGILDPNVTVQHDIVQLYR